MNGDEKHVKIFEGQIGHQRLRGVEWIPPPGERVTVKREDFDFVGKWMGYTHTASGVTAWLRVCTKENAGKDKDGDPVQIVYVFRTFSIPRGEAWTDVDMEEIHANLRTLAVHLAQSGAKKEKGTTRVLMVPPPEWALADLPGFAEWKARIAAREKSKVPP